MIVLAIDSGLEKTGYAFFDSSNNLSIKEKYLSSGLIKTEKNLSVEKRLLKIFNALSALVDKNKPSIIVMERLFFFKNQKSAITVSQAQGIAILLAAQKKIRVDFLTPLQIKQTVTGYGLSNKKAIIKMLHLLLNIEKKIKEDDEYDAIACGLAYCSINKLLTR